MKHYVLLMDFTDDYAARRADFRDEHLTKAWAAAERGELVLAGALTEPLDTGLLLFRAADRAPVERFAAADPYINNGLVRRWRIREWATVVGEDAATIVRPA